MNSQLYQIVGWNDRHESAKSRTYKCKGQLYMPSEFGLPYHKILRMENGERLFGAWCAMIHIASRQPLPRQGYLTNDGSKDGQPMTAGDLAMLTSFSEATMQAMLSVCSSPVIGWLRVERIEDTASIPDGHSKDTAGIPAGQHADSPVPLSLTNPSPSPLPEPANPVSEVDIPAKTVSESVTAVSGLQELAARFHAIRPEFRTVKDEAIHNAFRSFPPEVWESAMRDFERDMPNELQPPNNPPKKLLAYLGRADGRGHGNPTASRRSQYDKFRVKEPNK